VKCVDSRSGEVFEFELFDDEDADWLAAHRHRPDGPARRARCRRLGHDERVDAENWGWQRELLDWILENDQTICLKGRQLGVTWVACGLALWYLLYKPGTDVLIFSIGEDEAKEVVERIWGMFLSPGGPPAHLLNGVKVITPARGKPSTVIKVEHTLPDGTTRSRDRGDDLEPEQAGHSRSAALVIFDEALAQRERARDLEGVVPATADHGGKIVGISTANGMSDEKTGDGNFFHYLWSKAGTSVFPKLKTKFLGWWLHPDRDEEWYDERRLDPRRRPSSTRTIRTRRSSSRARRTSTRGAEALRAQARRSRSSDALLRARPEGPGPSREAREGRRRPDRGLRAPREGPQVRDRRRRRDRHRHRLLGRRGHRPAHRRALSPSSTCTATTSRSPTSSTSSASGTTPPASRSRRAAATATP
jgi:hypothetical protein